MKEAASRVSAVLGMFALLFSHRWVAQWQRSWRRALEGSVGAEGEGGRGGARTPAQRSGRARRAGPRSRGFYQRVFSLRVTLWYLLFQRLHALGTQAAVVADLRSGGADRLGRRGGGRLSRRTRSARTSAYNQARQRLPLELIQAALATLGTRMRQRMGARAEGRAAPAPDQRPRQLLDGSTLAMLATPSLVKEFAPARNQRGSSDWCLMRIVVGFCARSGVVLRAIGGAVAQSEQALAWALMEAGARWTLWIGDRNFGVWSVAAAARRHGQDVLVRLTQKRAARLCAGQGLSSGQERAIRWKPTRHDQVAPGVERTAVEGRLIYVRLIKAGKAIDLWLFTTLGRGDYPLELLVQWYGQRWQAELHFRSVKTQLELGELDVGSPAMAQKEFYAALLAYSLVRAVMWEAGERLESRVQALSFSQARQVLCQALQRWGRAQPAAGPKPGRWAEELLEEVALQTLPNRRRRRPSEVRRVRRRRQNFPPLNGPRAQARERWQSTESSLAKSL